MKKFIFIFLLVFCAAAARAASARDMLISGGREYKKGRYGAALDYYKKAEENDASSVRPVYNRAAALYKLKDYAASAEIYEGIAAGGGELRQDSYFNAGNARFRAADAAAAKEDYKRAILLNPKDKSAVHNLQILLSKNPENDKSENKKQDENKDQDNKNGQQGGGNNSDMSKADARRLMQLAREQEKKDRSRAQKQYGASGDVEKDW